MRAVMCGAGNIGRGFIGRLPSQSGYKVSFVDVNDTVIKAMNEAHSYPVDILLEDGVKEEWAENIDCVDGKDLEAVAAAPMFKHDDVLQEKSAEEILKEISGIEDTTRILAIYSRFKKGESLESVLWALKQEVER